MSTERGLVVQVRVNREEKRAAGRVAKRLGVTVAEAIRRLIVREDKQEPLPLVQQ